MIDYYTISHLNGWVEPQVFPMVEQINHLQKNLYGNIAEIGIYQGKFFIALASCLKQTEYAFAIDLFERQNENISGSGLGDLTLFSSNLSSLLPEAAICILKENSLNLRNKENFFYSLNSQSIRLFSIDGGHDYKEVKNDLEFAAATLHKKGVIIVDDFQHIGWDNVYRGTMDFLLKNSHVPIAMGGNKLFLCETDASGFYKDLKGLSKPEYCKTVNNTLTYEKAKSILDQYPGINLFQEQQHIF